MNREEIINEIKPILKELSYPSAVSYLTQNDKKWLEETIKVLEQDPFINKPCVSGEVCEHDKNNVLDKIKAEVLEYIDDLDIADAICEVFDKYKTEIETQESEG